MTITDIQAGNDTVRQSVAQRAYAIWEAEGCPQGRDFEHWLLAEAEINTPSAAGRQARRVPAKPRARARRRDA